MLGVGGCPIHGYSEDRQNYPTEQAALIGHRRKVREFIFRGSNPFEPRELQRPKVTQQPRREKPSPYGFAVNNVPGMYMRLIICDYEDIMQA